MAKVSLAGARKTANLTQKQLSEMLGVSRETVSKWESGKSELKPINLYAFCYITGFSADDIILSK